MLQHSISICTHIQPVMNAVFLEEHPTVDILLEELEPCDAVQSIPVLLTQHVFFCDTDLTTLPPDSCHLGRDVVMKVISGVVAVDKVV